MSQAIEETLEFEGVQYIVRIPTDAHWPAGRKFRILVSVHGTNGSAQAYMNIPVGHGDDRNFNLIIVAPQFPSETDSPDSTMNGGNFDFFASASHQWLYRLLHHHLPFLAQFQGLSLYTDKVYLFGHSKGGQFVHTYMMNHYSSDVLRAAICGAGFLRGKDHWQFRDMDNTEYNARLSALVRSHVAFIVGSSDCACGLDDGHLEVTAGGDAWEGNLCASGRDKWARQKEVIKYFNTELLPKIGRAYMRCIISQPPQWHPDGASFPIDQAIEVNPQVVKNVRFFWTPNPVDLTGQPVQGHRGAKNYVTARQYLFHDRLFICWPAIVETLISRLRLGHAPR